MSTVAKKQDGRLPSCGWTTRSRIISYMSSVEAHIPPYEIFRRIRGYCTIVCASTRAFQWALVRPLGIKTRWDMTSGLTTATATSALSRETPTKETPETAETHVEKRLKRLWVTPETAMKRLRSTSAGSWWLVWVSGGREWVLGSSKAVNAACLAVFDPSTNSALSRQPESAGKSHMGLYGPLRLSCIRPCKREK